jgi:hypothetical protein
MRRELIADRSERQQSMACFATSGERSEPHVGYALAILRETSRSDETIEVMDRESCHCLSLREADIDRNATAAVLASLERAPVCDTAAGGTEVKAEGLVAPNIGGHRAGYFDPLVLEAISPKRSIAPANGAVASGNRLQSSFEAPADAAAVTDPFDHPSPSIRTLRFLLSTHTEPTSVSRKAERERGLEASKRPRDERLRQRLGRVPALSGSDARLPRKLEISDVVVSGVPVDDEDIPRPAKPLCWS